MNVWFLSELHKLNYSSSLIKLLAPHDPGRLILPWRSWSPCNEILRLHCLLKFWLKMKIQPRKATESKKATTFLLRLNRLVLRHARPAASSAIKRWRATLGTIIILPHQRCIIGGGKRWDKRGGSVGNCSAPKSLFFCFNIITVHLCQWNSRMWWQKKARLIWKLGMLRKRERGIKWTLFLHPTEQLPFHFAPAADSRTEQVSFYHSFNFHL